MCGCLDKVEEEVKKQTKDENACVDFALVFGTEARMYPRISYSYQKRNKVGVMAKKKYEGTLLPTYCPWCGKKYDEANG